MTVNMAMMVVLVFVLADSENQVWYKKVIKALLNILEKQLTICTEATLNLSAPDVATTILNFTESTKHLTIERNTTRIFSHNLTT